MVSSVPLDASIHATGIPVRDSLETNHQDWLICSPCPHLSLTIKVVRFRFSYIVVLWVASIHRRFLPFSSNILRCQSVCTMRQNVSLARPEPEGTGQETDLNPRRWPFSRKFSAQANVDSPSSRSRRIFSASTFFSIRRTSAKVMASFRCAGLEVGFLSVSSSS
jgi:hypothetical protein